MAGYGYGSRGHTSRPAPLVEKWKKKPSHTVTEYTEHVEEEPKQATVESYVVKTERIVEQIRTPTMIPHKPASPVRNGVERNRWGRVPSPVRDRPQKVDDFITQVQTEVSQDPLPKPGLLSLRTRHAQQVQSVSPAPAKYTNGYPPSEYGRPETESHNLSKPSSPVQGHLLEYNTKIQTDEVQRSPMTRRGSFSFGTKHASDIYSPPPAEYKPSDNPSSEFGAKNDTEGRPSPSPFRGAELTRQPLIRSGFLGNTTRLPEQPQPVHHVSASPPKTNNTENNPWIRTSGAGMLGSSNWRQTPYSSAPNGAPGHSKTYYQSNSHYDGDYQYNNHKSGDLSPQPAARGTWSTRSSPATWATTPTQVTTPLTKPTNNINEAMNYLAGALQQQSSLTHSSPKQFYASRKLDHYTETIDSTEAQNRYGNYTRSSRPYAIRETCTTTIDSREALRKYGGAIV